MGISAYVRTTGPVQHTLSYPHGRRQGTGKQPINYINITHKNYKAVSAQGRQLWHVIVTHALTKKKKGIKLTRVNKKVPPPQDAGFQQK